ncbi:MAG: hypothetical protein KBT02_12060 [Treponema sp.]|nr:hypothetical protein [Candidatus Treponema caballi]
MRTKAEHQHAYSLCSSFSVLMQGNALTPPTSKTGTLTIALPGSGARRGYTQDDADFFKISIISESTKEVVIPAQEADTETFTAELKAGSYSVIVQSMINANSDMPLFLWPHEQCDHYSRRNDNRYNSHAGIPY